ncbi:MAG: ribosome maturation factor RimM [Aquificaceae bacterium]|nr:ribosome maturation factor RimM [Aquificaceae bacterium]
MQDKKQVNEENHYVVIGKVLDTYGIKGELKVLPYLEPKHWVGIRRVFLKRRGGGYVPFALSNIRFHGKDKLILGFEGYKNIAEAESFRGAKIFLPKEELPKKRKDEYYYYELEGLDVFTEEGSFLGRVTGVVEQRPYDLLEVDGGRLYIPFVKALVKEVNLKKGKVLVDESLAEI